MLDITAVVSLVGLGAFHGLNPAMGWLFAVALGLQERSQRAVVRAIGPIALGHAASLLIVGAAVWLAQAWVPSWTVRWVGGFALIGFAAYKLVKPLSHPRWVGMRVGSRDLVLWSFLMSTAHGAGLMLVPILVAVGEARAMDVGDHAAHVTGSGMPTLELGAIALHTLAMYAVMAVVALAVFQVFGLRILRSAWINLDRVWAIALMIAGVVTIVL
jgi:hypothetical protein